MSSTALAAAHMKGEVPTLNSFVEVDVINGVDVYINSSEVACSFLSNRNYAKAYLSDEMLSVILLCRGRRLRSHVTIRFLPHAMREFGPSKEGHELF